MSWEIFRCNLNTPTDDCTDKTSTKCISEALYQGITDGLVSSGLAASGYASVHMDVSGAGALATQTRAGLTVRAAALIHLTLQLDSKLRRTAGRRRTRRATRRPTSCAATRSASPRA
jgi:hypothetical protein